MLARARRADPVADAAAGVATVAGAVDLATLIPRIPELIQNLYSDDPAVVLEAALRVRDMMAVDKNPPTDLLIASNAVPALMHALTHGEVNVQFEAAWSLTNIASGKPEHTRAVVEGGAIPTLVALLSSEAVTVREQVVWALGNIAGDNAAYRDTILSYGAMDIMLGICHTKGKIGMLRNATWSLSNLCRGAPAPDFALVARALPTLNCMVSFYDEDVIADACWALTYLSDSNALGNEERAQHQIQCIIEAGVVPKVIEHLGHKSVYVITPALRVVGNLATGSDVQTDILLQHDLLPALLNLMQNPRRGVRKEACWTVSNITAGPPGQIDEVMRANIFPTLIEFLRCKDFDVRKEATWAVTNAIASQHETVIRYLVEYSVIPSLAELLDPESPEPRVLNAILESLKLILALGAADAEQQRAVGHATAQNVYAELLERSGHVDTVAALQSHADPSVADHAYTIIRMHYHDDDGAIGDELAPQVADNGTFQFEASPDHVPNSDFHF